jgi:hypothetical protein
LLAQYNVTVLPGSLLAREAHGVNPGAGRIRMALVAEIDECVEAAQRIVAYTLPLTLPPCPVMTQQLQSIETAWDHRAELSTTQAPADVREAVAHVIAELDAGRLRVAERQGVGQWQVNQWIKKAVLLSFRLNDNRVMRAATWPSSTRWTPSSAP